MRGLPRLLLTLCAAIAAAGLMSSAASAAGNQISIFEDDSAVLSNPGPTIQQLRGLGVGVLRLGVHWSSIAPSPTSRRKPDFNAADPNAYPSANWVAFDATVTDAAAAGIQVLLVPTAFAPYWAQGANPGKYGAHYDVRYAFMPSASAYGQFVRALGTRYSGHFKPPGARTALPAVHLWELYNEPNFGEDLAPQGIDGSHVLYAPVMYRGLLNAGWDALRATGHGRDTILIGALAARGSHVPTNNASQTGTPGAYGETPPLEFIRDLYCLDSSYHQYRSSAAAIRRCPTTAAASRRFRAQNPALFSASGFSIHPYPLTNDANEPPTKTRYHNPNFVSFSQLPNLIKTLDRAQRVYGSERRLPVWNTEYGYLTNPPNADPTDPNVSPTTQAYYLNWAEYLSWRNSRIVSTMQYLLYDPNPNNPDLECGGFASGLVFSPVPATGPGCAPFAPGTPKPSYNAYRLPLYMANSFTRPGGSLTVWGCVRPGHFALLDTHTPQRVQIQFQRGSRGAWVTVSTVTIRNPSASCYFNVQVKFPASGSVRLAWSYPPTDIKLPPPTPTPGGYTDPLIPVLSRVVTVKIA